MDLLEKIWTSVGHLEAQFNQLRVEFKGMRADLNYHIKRTDQHASELQEFEDHIKKIEDEVIRPISNDVWRFKAIGGIIVALGACLCGLLGWLINILLTRPEILGGS